MGISSSAHHESAEAPTRSMHGVLESQRAAFLAEGKVDAETRIDRLDRTRRMIGENQDAIIDACSRDFGNRSRHQSRMSEVMSVMAGLQHARDHVRKWMRMDRRKVMFPLGLMGARARVEVQPKGVVGVIGTWNFPVYTSILPLAGIFAAGNRAMVKPSEVTPFSGLLVGGHQQPMAFRLQTPDAIAFLLKLPDDTMVMFARE